MLDEKKIKLMTRMASYEANQGKEDLAVSAYYRKDYTSLHTLFSFFWGTLGYVCLIGLLVLGSFDFLMEHLTMGMFFTLGTIAVLGYFVIIVIYVVAANRFYNKKHIEARTRIKKFNYNITRLLKIYEKENR